MFHDKRLRRSKKCRRKSLSEMVLRRTAGVVSRPAAVVTQLHDGAQRASLQPLVCQRLARDAPVCHNGLPLARQIYTSLGPNGPRWNWNGVCGPAGCRSAYSLPCHSAGGPTAYRSGAGPPPGRSAPGGLGRGAYRNLNFQRTSFYCNIRLANGNFQKRCRKSLL